MKKYNILAGALALILGSSASYANNSLVDEQYGGIKNRATVHNAASEEKILPPIEAANLYPEQVINQVTFPAESIKRALVAAGITEEVGFPRYTRKATFQEVFALLSVINKEFKNKVLQDAVKYLWQQENSIFASGPSSEYLYKIAIRVPAVSYHAFYAPEGATQISFSKENPNVISYEFDPLSPTIYVKFGESVTNKPGDYDCRINSNNKFGKNCNFTQTGGFYNIMIVPSPIQTILPAGGYYRARNQFTGVNFTPSYLAAGETPSNINIQENLSLTNREEKTYDVELKSDYDKLEVTLTGNQANQLDVLVLDPATQEKYPMPLWDCSSISLQEQSKKVCTIPVASIGEWKILIGNHRGDNPTIDANLEIKATLPQQ